jgi:hypothetical protein
MIIAAVYPRCNTRQIVAASAYRDAFTPTDARMCRARFATGGNRSGEFSSLLFYRSLFADPFSSDDERCRPGISVQNIL